jgi:pimeloyl-ACP methyl ester carboxylesterase
MKKRIVILFLILVPSFLCFDFIGTSMIVEVRGGIRELFSGDYTFPKNHPVYADSTVEHFSAYSVDSTSIYCSLLKSRRDSAKGTVIFLHGITNDSRQFYPEATRLADSGYHAILVDLRGHGRSEGRFCTYGYYEKFDIKAVVDAVEKRNLGTDNIGIWGYSLGGAVALQTLAICPELKFGIIESTFSDYPTIAHEYTRRFSGFDYAPLTDYLITRSGSMADFKPEEVVPAESCKKITCPIILSHGTDDKRINIYHARINFENLASNDKELITIEGATHLNLHEIGGEEYFEKVFAFLENRYVENNLLKGD